MKFDGLALTARLQGSAVECLARTPPASAPSNQPAQRPRRGRADDRHPQNSLRGLRKGPEAPLAVAISDGQVVEKCGRGTALRGRVRSSGGVLLDRGLVRRKERLVQVV